MATPHVAGLAAYLISVGGNMSPAALSSAITSLALKGVLAGVRKYSKYIDLFPSLTLLFSAAAGTVNGLINNGYTGN
jgi:subtilisin family serine protease